MPSVVVLVEGASDAAVVRVLCEARGIDTGRVEIRDMGGVTNLAHHLEVLDGATAVLGLYDAPEEAVVVRTLRRLGYDVDRRRLTDLGFVSCDRDLEDELIRALGPARVEVVIDRLGQLEQLRAFQRQPQWRGRDPHDQLRRFAGTASGRKEVLARSLAEELTAETTPTPLRQLVEAVAEAVAR